MDPSTPRPPSAPTAALKLDILGPPELKANLLALFAGVGHSDLTDALRAIYAVAKARSVKPFDYDGVLARGVNFALCQSDPFWLDAEPLTPPARKVCAKCGG